MCFFHCILLHGLWACYWMWMNEWMKNVHKKLEVKPTKQAAAAADVRVHRRRKDVDAVKSTLAQHNRNRSRLVLVEPMSNCQLLRQHWLPSGHHRQRAHWVINVSYYRLRCTREDPRLQSCYQMSHDLPGQSVEVNGKPIYHAVFAIYCMWKGF